MLVISRKLGEKIRIPELDLSITIVRIQGNRVRLGLEAAEDVQVYREEVWDRLDGFAPEPEPTLVLQG